MSKPAIKSSWKTLAPLGRSERLGYECSFAIKDMERLREGVIPQQMEDKWFIYYQDGWLYLHRSWTGALIYWVKFEEGPDGARALESFVSRDPVQYKETDLSYDRSLLDFLVHAILLGKNVPFPVRQKDVSAGPKGIYQHHLVGRGYPEKVVPEK